jgi:hypothetical protein
MLRLLAICAGLVLPGLATPALAFPEMEIGRGDTRHEWPFSVDSGTLICVSLQGQETVLFSEPWRTDVPQELGNMTLPRSVIVSTNVFALLVSIEDRALYLPFDSLETLIRRLAPFETMGRELCRQDAGLPVGTRDIRLVNERGPFHFPMSEDDFRIQRIDRTDREKNWPFSVDSGYLVCVWLMGQRTVYFADGLQDADEKPRVLVLSTNPLDLALANIGVTGLFVPFDGFESMIARVGPFVSLGRRLCDQPRGSDIGPGEL